MADEFISPRWGALQAYTGNYPALRGDIAAWNSGASDVEPKFENMNKYASSGLMLDDRKIFEELLKQMLAQTVKPRQEKIEDWEAK
jgi:hypothetical protein